MQESCDSDPFLAHSTPIVSRKAHFLCVIVRKFQRAVEQMIQLNLFPDGLLSGGRLTGLQEIPPANFDGRDPYDTGDAVHVPLHGEKALRRPKSAKGSMRRRICCYRLRSNPHTRPIIRTTGVNRAAR